MPFTLDNAVCTSLPGTSLEDNDEIIIVPLLHAGALVEQVAPRICGTSRSKTEHYQSFDKLLKNNIERCQEVYIVLKAFVRARVTITSLKAYESSLQRKNDGSPSSHKRTQGLEIEVKHFKLERD